MIIRSTAAFAAAAIAAPLALLSPAFAQTGALDKAVGGYSFDEAAKEAQTTRDFHSKDGRLTFAIITHTAGNGFFDPTYVGAKVAADAFGINLLMLGSEAPRSEEHTYELQSLMRHLYPVFCLKQKKT